MINITLSKFEILYCIKNQINDLKRDYYRFTVNILDSLESIEDDGTLVTIAIPGPLLVQIHSGVSEYPHGMARHINPVILEKITPQVMEQSNLPAVQAQTEEPNEATLALLAMQAKINQDEALIPQIVAEAKRELEIY